MTKRNISWNFIGTFVYSIITILLATIVRRADAAMADEFTFDFKLAQLLLTVGYFEVRVFQVTDSKSKYRFGEYLGFRVITCIAMMLMGIIYFIFSGKDIAMAPLIILLCGYKMLDALADVFEGDYQKNERIDISGKSMTIRTLAGAIAFTVVIMITKNTIWAALALVVVAALVIIIYNPRQRKAYGAEKEKISFSAFMPLFKDTLLLAVGAFLCTYLLNCSSYAIDAYAPDNNYIFGALFMPASVINLVATMLYKPMLTTWTRKADEKDYKGFVKLFLAFAGFVVILTLVCMAGGWLIGMPILSAVYAVDLTGYRVELMLLLIGGGLNALSILIYYGLVVLRCQRNIFICYVITLIATLAVPYISVKRNALLGGSLAFLIVMLVQCIIFGSLFLYNCLKLSKNN